MLGKQFTSSSPRFQEWYYFNTSMSQLYPSLEHPKMRCVTGVFTHKIGSGKTELPRLFWSGKY